MERRALTALLIVWVSVCPLLAVADPDTGEYSPHEQPDRYLFDRASEAYQLFGELRVGKPLSRVPHRVGLSPVIQKSAPPQFGRTIGSQMLFAIQSGQVVPDDILLPNATSRGTQGSSD